MSFPETPITVIGRLSHHQLEKAWETSWEEFFDLYHHAVLGCVAANLARYGWKIGEDSTQEVALKVFHAILRGNQRFDPVKGRFRNFLSTICRRRVIDYIREHRDDKAHEPLSDLQPSQNDGSNALVDKEFNDALLVTLLAALRTQVSPRVYMIFESVKLHCEDPNKVAETLGIRRGVVDNSVFKAMDKLRLIAKSPEIREEFDL